MEQGTIGSMRQLGITESYKLKRQVVLSASEAAEMIIRYVCVITLLHRVLIYLCPVLTIFFGLLLEDARPCNGESILSLMYTQ